LIETDLLTDLDLNSWKILLLINFTTVNLILINIEHICLRKRKTKT